MFQQGDSCKGQTACDTLQHCQFPFPWQSHQVLVWAANPATDRNLSHINTEANDESLAIFGASSGLLVAWVG